MRKVADDDLAVAYRNDCPEGSIKFKLSSTRLMGSFCQPILRRKFMFQGKRTVCRPEDIRDDEDDRELEHESRAKARNDATSSAGLRLVGPSCS